MEHSKKELYKYKVVDEFLGGPIEICSIMTALNIGLIHELKKGKVDVSIFCRKKSLQYGGVLNLVKILIANKVIADMGSSKIQYSPRFKEAMKFEDLLFWKAWYLIKIYKDIINNFKRMVLSDFKVNNSSASRIFDYESWNRKIEDDNQNNVNGIKFMSTLTKYDAIGLLDNFDFSNVNNILDIGGNSGELALRIVQKYPKKNITVIDFESVCEFGRKHVFNSIGKSNIIFEPGDFFKCDFGNNRGLVILKSVLNDHSTDKVTTILQKAYDCIRNGGKILIYEFEKKSLDSEKCLKENVLFLNFWNCFRSCEEYENIMNKIGFINFKRIKIKENGFFLLIAEKPKKENTLSPKDYITLTVEFDCNCDCVSCMLRGYKDKLKPISLDQFKQLVVEKSSKYKGLILSGAEVTVNKNLKEYVSYASKYFKVIRIQTNGRKLSNKVYCKELIDFGVSEFYVSINGHNARIHEAISRKENSFRETIQGLYNLNRFGVRIITNTVITKLNYRYIPKIIDIVSQNGIKEVELWNYWPMEYEDINDLCIEYEKILPFLFEAIEHAKRANIKITLKHFPECLLKKDSNYLDNDQPETIIDGLYWEKYKQNSFGNCPFRENCLSEKCYGFPLAYVRKFGVNKDILIPLCGKTNSCSFSETMEIKKLENHKKTFKIKQDKYLTLFEEMLVKDRRCRLECSVKIEEGNIFPCRFNVWYKNIEKSKGLNHSLNFIKELSNRGVKINYELLNRILDLTSGPKIIGKVIAGIDLRDNLNESRAKLWLAINPEKREIFESILKEYKINKKVSEVMIRKDFLFGLDLCFDGRTKLKIYPHFNRVDLNNKKIRDKLKGVFSSRVMNLIRGCHKLNISFEDKANERILHFHPLDLGSFIRKVNNRKLNETIKSINSQKEIVIVSLKENEINNNNIKNINFYY
jgi:LynF/TruF/PatF family peptide O-prenyltransferase